MYKKCSNCEMLNDEDDLNLWDRCARCQGLYDAYVKVLDIIKSPDYPELSRDDFRKAVENLVPR